MTVLRTCKIGHMTWMWILHDQSYDQPHTQVIEIFCGHKLVVVIDCRLRILLQFLCQIVQERAPSRSRAKRLREEVYYHQNKQEEFNVKSHTKFWSNNKKMVIMVKSAYGLKEDMLSWNKEWCEFTYLIVQNNYKNYTIIIGRLILQLLPNRHGRT